MDELTVVEAAHRLALDPSRVRALVAGGFLAGRRVGDRWLVDTATVERWADVVGPGARSRPMSPRVAWAAADLLDGGRADWLTAGERSRLRRRRRLAHPCRPTAMSGGPTCSGPWCARRRRSAPTAASPSGTARTSPRSATWLS